MGLRRSHYHVAPLAAVANMVKYLHFCDFDLALRRSIPSTASPLGWTKIPGKPKILTDC